MTLRLRVSDRLGRCRIASEQAVAKEARLYAMAPEHSVDTIGEHPEAAVALPSEFR